MNMPQFVFLIYIDVVVKKRWNKIIRCKVHETSITKSPEINAAVSKNLICD